MNRNNRHGKHKNWGNQKNSGSGSSKEGVKNFQENKFQFVNHENEESFKKKEQAIQELKSREVICPLCQKAITDIASAIADKASGKPVHFECVMNQLAASETVGVNEKICYIGQGRFGILYFENPRDQRHFQIKKLIEWENRDTKSEWRDEVSSLYSQVE